MYGPRLDAGVLAEKTQNIPAELRRSARGVDSHDLDGAGTPFRMRQPESQGNSQGAGAEVKKERRRILPRGRQFKAGEETAEAEGRK